MTCIVGVEAPGHTVIGGDSAGVDDQDLLVVRADAKVFALLGGEFVVGFTDSFRMGQLLRYGLRLPAREARDTAYRRDPERFMAVTFIDAVRSCLARGGFARKEDEVESAGTFLVGWRERLYEVGDDYQVGRSTSGYAAVGGGASIAFGALHATAGGGSSGAGAACARRRGRALGHRARAIRGDEHAPAALGRADVDQAPELF